MTSGAVKLGSWRVAFERAEAGGSEAALVAIGWATVDALRAADEFGMEVQQVRGDDSLGAAAWLAGPAAWSARLPPNVRLVLLEPTREGRLAAALARHDEGPLAFYIERAALAGLREEGPVRLLAARAGPFGWQRLLTPTQPWGPFLVAVDRPSSDATR